MTFLLYAVVLLLLLILLRESSYKLHSLLTIIFFFVLLHFLIKLLVFPFTEQLLSYVGSVPYVPQLIYSALFYQIGHFIYKMFEEEEYEAIGELVLVSVRIVLLLYWTSELKDVLTSFSSILDKLQ